MINLSKDNKRLLKYLGIIFIAVLLTYKLPHDSYSIIQYIIRPIRYKNSTIYLSGIIPLILFIIGIKGLFKLERFAHRSKILIFIVVTFIIIPVMKSTLDFTRTSYYALKGTGLRAVDIVDANADLTSSNKELAIDLKLELIDYGKRGNEFKIRVHLPEKLSEYTGKEFYEFEKNYVTHGNRNKIKIDEQIVIKSDNDNLYSTLSGSQWYLDEFEYELYNEKEVIKIIDRGL
jgi:hypothetical protein